jgi:hypothetical protein
LCDTTVKENPGTVCNDTQEDRVRFEQRIVSNVAIVKVIGDITLNEGGDVLLKDKVQSLLHQGYKNVLFDLGAVSVVNSAGLGEMVLASPHIWPPIRPHAGLSTARAAQASAAA